MIDAHCHLEQPEYLQDLDQVIELCKREGLKAIITVCADPKDFDRSLEIVDKYKNYVFLCAAIHPEFVKEITAKQVDEYFDRLEKNKDRLVAIGECGLDYFWIKEDSWREKQKELFVQHVELSKELKLPLVIHSRDAWEDALKILEQEDVKKALLHLWGSKELIPRVIENNYSITMGPIIARSKKHKKIARDMPIENILLETDSPWFGQNGERGLPTNVKIPCQKIAEVKKVDISYVNDITDKNAVDFFSLRVL
ncbi:MAG: TatD family hydrolase [Candidatus Aenigmatarchaeota archaeon]|nr:TatD family hydrolase [Candidatus Aenigmarchaeota archaeon]